MSSLPANHVLPLFRSPFYRYSFFSSPSLSFSHFPLGFPYFLPSLVDVSIIVPKGEQPTCSICLASPIIAPQITLCSHQFCLPCLLALFFHQNAASPRAPKCPACSAIVEPNSYRPCQYIEDSGPIGPGTELTFQLVERKKSSINGRCPSLPTSSSAFSRLLAISDLSPIFERQLISLTTCAAMNEADEENNPFLEQAINYLLTRQSSPHQYYSCLDLPLIRSLMPNITSQDIQSIMSPPPNGGLQGDAGSCYYYYQLHDGRPVFLSSINYRLIQSAHTQPTNMPLSITMKCEDLQSVTMDAAAKRKLRFLGHLEESARVAFAFGEFTEAAYDTTSHENGMATPAASAGFSVIESLRASDEFVRDFLAYRALRKADRRRVAALNARSRVAAAASQKREDAEAADYMNVMYDWPADQGEYYISPGDGFGESVHNEASFPSLAPQGAAGQQAGSPQHQVNTQRNNASGPASPAGVGVWSTIASRGLAATATWAPLSANAADEKKNNANNYPPLGAPAPKKGVVTGSPSPWESKSWKPLKK